MPIPRRNFELGILPDVEAWMVSVAVFLSGRRGDAYSKGELLTQAHPGAGRPFPPATPEDSAAIGVALEELLTRGAIEQRLVTSGPSEPDSYYAFKRDLNTETWKPS